jgi:septal ring factor EnvC (AmiA/AmiB activator)
LSKLSIAMQVVARARLSGAGAAILYGGRNSPNRAMKLTRQRRGKKDRSKRPSAISAPQDERQHNLVQLQSSTSTEATREDVLSACSGVLDRFSGRLGDLVADAVTVMQAAARTARTHAPGKQQRKEGDGSKQNPPVRRWRWPELS